jgi:uroporphyrinogen III methyltransferase/synthase
MTDRRRVILVGAGPGDPGLLTIRGKEALQQADVVLYDRLVTREILDFARPGAELVNVGKGKGVHSIPQEEINRGRYVVRLKNGDPFVFGRGGEETRALAEAGIPFEVIPGITAAMAAAAYCGLPLTQRGLSSSLTLLTGHEDPTKGRSDINWRALAESGGTLVLYMGMAHLAEVVGNLIDSGKAADTPAAVICKATTPDQVQVIGTLAELPRLVAEKGLTPPSIVIIGEVVGARD